MTDHDEKRIRELLAARAEAMTKRDAATVTSGHTTDVVGYTLAPPLRQTPASVTDTAARRQWFATFDGPIDYEIRDLEVTVGGDVAFTTSLNRLTTTPKGMPSQFDLWFRSTLCFRREDGDWRIAHLHESTPFYMDGTLRAALDLKP